MSANADTEPEIDDDDLCPICRHLLHRPVVTQCSHTLCESCMAEWADVSISSQTAIVPLNEETENFAAANLQAKCPMCRTVTSAERSLEVEERIKGKYPDVYQQREDEEREDEAAAAAEGSDKSVETITVYIGNSVERAVRNENGETTYHYTFFVNISDTSVINEVEIVLHETFRNSRILKRKAPYSVSCSGWGTFVVRANVILKAGYSWISSDAVDTRYAKKASLPLEWDLSFEGEGSQARCRLKIKNERRRLRARN